MLIIIGNACTPNLCQNSGVCSLNSDSKAACKCIFGWTGLTCSISLLEIDKLIKMVTDTISSIKDDFPITDKQITTLSKYSDLVKSNPSLITHPLTQDISKIAKTQVELIEESKAPIKPEFLNILDFSLYLSL